ncbi:hypothetical protein MKK69_22920 [Methylobacterium sp. J-026]|jgi:hypothetical protein|uniref:hypothetical protein n=1 Tax=unclassified Methylobacterium TaxID=2615210 RepID=UPI0011C93D69|nr:MULTISPECIES: hypothetical protein [unclassified Methylobacterium]MCJ2136868.1 hypothetical protein [Methylobacterium sp. J-026]TXM71131.1 hypothetical protein FV229_00170 [Methylobacterium sp. WL120]
MTIAVLPPKDAFTRIASSLSVPDPGQDAERTVAFVCQVIRRAALAVTPCGRAALEAVAVEALKGFWPDRSTLALAVEQATEELLVYGDLLEMQVPVEGSVRASFVIRAAPPHHVMRGADSCVILGLGNEEITPLPASTLARVHHIGALRLLEGDGASELSTYLAENGFPGLDLKGWLRLPREETPGAFLRVWWDKLAAQDRSGEIEGLRVISVESSVRYYKGRWVEPAKMSGRFVARRPQAFGADLWCIVELDGGRPVRLLDITSAGDLQRPCDIAWRIQMAQDALVGRRQVFRVVRNDDGTFLEFLSPLPSWAQRRLLVSGARAQRPRCLMAFATRPDELPNVLHFLKNCLWLEETTH